MVEIVVHPLVRRRCLLADGLQRGMRLQQSHRGGEAEVGDPEDPDSAVARNILDQPVDGVVSVSALVDDLRVCPVSHRIGRANPPSDLNRPRTLWKTKIYPSFESSSKDGWNRIPSLIRHSVRSALHQNWERLFAGEWGSRSPFADARRPASES